jgi:hypothetical protein
MRLYMSQPKNWAGWCWGNAPDLYLGGSQISALAIMPEGFHGFPHSFLKKPG